MKKNLIVPMNEIPYSKAEKKTLDADSSFGGWADMDKTTEKICSEIRAGRIFRNRDLV